MSDKLLVYLGAGADRIKHFTHLDNNIKKQNKNGKNVRASEILHDLRDQLPFQAESVDLFYSIHTMEHLKYSELMACLVDCFSSLKLNGVIRIVVPDFDCVIKDYLESKNVDVDKWDLDKELPIRNPSELFTYRMLYHDHYYLHNKKTLSTFLNEAGFDHIKVCSPGETRMNYLSEIFSQKERGRYGGDLIIEASKNGQLIRRDNPWRTMPNNRERLSLFLNLKIARKRPYLAAFPELDWFKSLIRKNKSTYCYFPYEKEIG
jgi:predicted SAM-dependent methyltransferase